MPRRRRPTWTRALLIAAWAALLVIVPWWLGLPLWLALVAVAVLHGRRRDRHVRWVRGALRWGLPGLLLGIVWTLGGSGLAWIVALLGALTGFTLIVALEAWLDRDLRRASVPTATEPSASADWPQLAMASTGPPATIIELAPPQWQATTPWLVSSGEPVHFYDSSFHFADGSVVDGVDACAAFSPNGRWFAARLPDGAGLVLRDRERDRQHRLRGWQLCGWHDDQPWLTRSDEAMPLPLSAALGEPDR